MSAVAGMREGVVRRRGIVALLALVLLSVLLSAAAAAYAAEVVITYKDPNGGTTTETDGTITYEGSHGTQIEGMTVYRDETKEFKDLDGLTCEPANAEHQCDEFDLFSNNATVEAKAPCVQDFTYYCPDADYWVANLGKGFGNYFTLGGSLEYIKATLTAGSGNAEISGTPNPSVEGFPDEDIITGGSEGTDHLYGGPGNDTIYGGAANSTIDGGAGNDTIYADSGNDAINGGPGNDTIYGGTGNSYIFGGPGNDVEVGGSGTDLLGWSAFGLPETGEPDKGENTFESTGGNTIVSFEYAKGPVEVSLDGVANDGEAGQKDNVEPGVAEVRGSEYNDTLIAGAPPVILNGEGGNDTIYGGPGGDTLIGGEGNDTIYTKGPAGDGPDQIFAGVPGCALDECPGGNDTIYAADGIADQISCDAGADILYADQLDVIANSVNAPCSSIHRETVAAPGGAGGGSGGGGGGGGGGVSIAPIVFSVLKAPHNVKTLLKSGLTVSTSCPAACSLSAQATISASNAKKAHITAAGKSVVVGTGHATLLAAGSVKVKINLTSKAKRDLKRLGRFTIAISITAKNAAGATTTTTKTITI
jgi:Ca2+-binding RTX toxin-like protein